MLNWLWCPYTVLCAVNEEHVLLNLRMKACFFCCKNNYILWCLSRRAPYQVNDLKLSNDWPWRITEFLPCHIFKMNLWVVVLLYYHFLISWFDHCTNKKSYSAEAAISWTLIYHMLVIPNFWWHYCLSIPIFILISKTWYTSVFHQILPLLCLISCK